MAHGAQGGSMRKSFILENNKIFPILIIHLAYFLNYYLFLSDVSFCSFFDQFSSDSMGFKVYLVITY